MISELERINALNLEPSLPKVDDGNRNVNRYSQDRNKVKNEFQTFLSEMKRNDEAKAGNTPNPTSSSTGSKPSGGGPEGQKPGATSSQQNLSLQPVFQVENGSPDLVLEKILSDMLKQASSVPTASLEPEWPEAQGPSYKEVLGRPTGKPNLVDMSHAGDAGARPGHGPQGNNARPPMGQGQDQMRPMGPPGQGGMHHQQQQQQQQQQGGYMMQGGPQQGGQPQMPMFMPGGMGQGPQGMQGQQMMMMNMQGQQMGQPQMFAQGPNGPMGQQMAVPMGMMAAPQQGGPGGQGGNVNPGMNPGMPYDGQQQQQMMFMPVMMSQDGQQYTMPQQGMQGYPQQQGGNTGNPQQGFMMQQPMYNQHQQGNS